MKLQNYDFIIYEFTYKYNGCIYSTYYLYSALVYCSNCLFVTHLSMISSVEIDGSELARVFSKYDVGFMDSSGVGNSQHINGHKYARIVNT